MHTIVIIITIPICEVIIFIRYFWLRFGVVGIPNILFVLNTSSNLTQELNYGGVEKKLNDYKP